MKHDPGSLYHEEGAVKQPLEFYDVKAKKKFTSEEWRIETKLAKGRPRYFAVSKVPGAAHEAWRIVTEAFAKSNG
jgi:hypothetical protein